MIRSRPGYLQPCGCGDPPPSLHSFSRSDDGGMCLFISGASDPKGARGTEPSRTARSSGPAQHSPTLSLRHLFEVSQRGTLFSFSSVPGVFSRRVVMACHQESITSQAGPPGITIPSSGGWCVRVCGQASRPVMAPMFSPFFFSFKVIRVPAVVETGTDVPARGNGLISCRPFPPGRLPPFPPRYLPVGMFFYVTWRGGRAESCRTACTQIIHP